MSKKQESVTSSSISAYFSKNLQQVGFSSPTKAVLTTLKESVDNSLDACEEAGILPEIEVTIVRLGAGSGKNTDQIQITVRDNGPGIPEQYLASVFGEFLASSKFGRGRCTRGQQGIGISAATTWAQMTQARGVAVITKLKGNKKATSCLVEVDIKNNKGAIRSSSEIEWPHASGTEVSFIIDGKIQLNGDAGLLSYLNGTALVNPHLELTYELQGMEGKVSIPRVSSETPLIPEAVEPHPHTMKLGEMMAHSHLSPDKGLDLWLKTDFTRINEQAIADLKKNGVPAGYFQKKVGALTDQEFKTLFSSIQEISLMAPVTRSVMSIGEETLGKSIHRLGETDFFSVVTRKPAICDFKPVQIEVAMARLSDSRLAPDSPVQVLRFANRVPLQFDKSACAIVQAVQSVNWKAYGLDQPKESLPQGPYVIAVSVVSPFIKFKNASKETLDASDELVEEIRLALIQAGQKLAKHIKKEEKADELEENKRYIEQFCPILISALCRMTDASAARKSRAEEGLKKILGRDNKETMAQLEKAETALEKVTGTLADESQAPRKSKK